MAQVDRLRILERGVLGSKKNSSQKGENYTPLRFSIWLFCCVRLTTSTHDIEFKFSGVKECNKTRLKT